MFCKVYLQCGIIIQRVVTIRGVPSVQLSRMMDLQIEFAKNKCLGTIWSTQMMPIVWTYPAREHYKTLISCDFPIWPPLCSWPIIFNTISTPDCKRRVTQQYMTYLCTDINLTGLSLVIFLRVEQIKVVRFFFCRVYDGGGGLIQYIILG